MEDPAPFTPYRQDLVALASEDQARICLDTRQVHKATCIPMCRYWSIACRPHCGGCASSRSTRPGVASRMCLRPWINTHASAGLTSDMSAFRRIEVIYAFGECSFDAAGTTFGPSWQPSSRQVCAHRHVCEHACRHACICVRRICTDICTDVHTGVRVDMRIDVCKGMENIYECPNIYRNLQI